MLYKSSKICGDINFYLENRLIYKGEESGIPDLAGIRDVRNYPKPVQPDKGGENSDEGLDVDAEKKRLMEEVEAKRIAEEAAQQERELKSQVDKRRVALSSNSDKKSAGRRREKLGIKAEKTEEPPITLEEGIKRTEERLNKDLLLSEDEDKLKPYKEGVKAAMEAADAVNKLHDFIGAHKAYGGKDNDFKKWNEDLCNDFGLELYEGEDEDTDRMRYAAALQLYLAEYFHTQSKAKGDIFQTTQQNPNPFIRIDGKLGGYTMSVLAAYWNDKFPKEKRSDKEDLKFAILEPTYGQQRKNNEIYGNAIKYLEDRLSGKSLDNAPTAAQAVAQGAPANAPSVPPQAPSAAPSKDVETKLSPEQQQQVKELVKGATEFTFSPYGLFGKLQKLHEQQSSDYNLLEKRSAGPNGASFLEFNSRKGSWPDRFFTEYKELYESSDKSDSAKVMDKQIIDKFGLLKDVVEDYYAQVGLIKASLFDVYRKKAETIMSEYELPVGINVTDLEEKKSAPISNAHTYSSPYGSGSLPPMAIDNDVYVERWRNIRLDKLRKSDFVDNLFKQYFKIGFDTKKVPNSLTVDMFAGGTDDERKDNMDAFVKLVGRGKGLNEAVSQLKEVIYLRNIYHVNSEYNTMKKHFDFDFNKAVGILDNSYSEYQALKTKDEKNKLASNAVKKIWA